MTCNIFSPFNLSLIKNTYSSPISLLFELWVNFLGRDKGVSVKPSPSVKRTYSKYSFYCALALLSIILLMSIVLALIPSPPMVEFFGDILIYLIAPFSIAGIYFAAKGITETNNFKKWLGIITNLFFFAIICLEIWNLASR